MLTATARRLPAPLASRLRRLRDALRAPRARRALAPVAWGGLRRAEPLCPEYGRSRGRPVDRRLIEAFLEANAASITGAAIEVGGATYVTRFGRAVTSIDVLDIDPRNPEATVIGDLSDVGALPTGRYDCAIATQVLQYLPDPGIGLGTLYAALAPGGTLLVTAPTLSRRDRGLAAVDRWRFMPSGLAQLASGACPGAIVDAEGRGNLLAATAFLLGAAQEDLTLAEIDRDDPDFPLVACAVIRRPA